ncbi:hypothetical protein [Kitasatospora sp. NPDC057541]|uniref:hypothetical protein n=1 Tax=unclassified Kitasatospora TaxID=2633591 RepID=UPI003688BC5F
MRVPLLADSDVTVLDADAAHARRVLAAAAEAAGLRGGQADALFDLLAAAALDRAGRRVLALAADDDAHDADAVSRCAALLQHSADGLAARAAAAGVGDGQALFGLVPLSIPVARGSVRHWQRGRAPAYMWTEERLRLAGLGLAPGQSAVGYEAGRRAGELVPLYSPAHARALRATATERALYAERRICRRCGADSSVTLPGRLCAPCRAEQADRTCSRCLTVWSARLADRWEDSPVCPACSAVLAARHGDLVAVFDPPTAVGYLAPYASLDWSRG